MKQLEYDCAYMHTQAGSCPDFSTCSRNCNAVFVNEARSLKSLESIPLTHHLMFKTLIYYPDVRLPDIKLSG